ncbi:MAG TPA: diphosphomevalonate decarboxylase [Pseudomonadales bacterium]
MTTTALAHPNIALIKYWGKQALAGNIPATPSLSITLDTLCSTTSVADAAADRIVLDGRVVEDSKIRACLAMLREEFDVGPLEIVSDNNFPTAAGLASSASGFAALVTAIDAHCALRMSDRDRSLYSRRASGSAARSIYGGFVGLSAPDWVAEPLLDADDWPLNVVIAITDEQRKNVSSSAGMRLSEETSPYYEPWVRTTAEDFAAARLAVDNRDFSGLAELAEASCLKMHGVMQSSRPAMIYWRPATIACMHAVRALRGDGEAVFFTIDAGPQVKAVCLPSSLPAVAARLAEIPGVLTTHTVGLGGGAHVMSK